MANTRSIPATEKQIETLKDRRRRAQETIRDVEPQIVEAETYLKWLKAEPGKQAPAQA